MKFFEIADRTVGTCERTLVIAELGVNHDGSFLRAAELVQQAGQAGADVVKFQIFRARQLVHPSAQLADYQRKRASEETVERMLSRYELSPQEIAKLCDLTRELGMVPLATPFSPEDVETIGELNLPAIKVASPDLINRMLLEKAASLRRPMLVSTGAATIEEVDRCVEWLTEWGVPFVLMHCVSAYPAPSETANLCWISELAERFNVPVGFSDHTNDLLSGAFAVSAGACIVERHLTYDRAANGPDHAASATPSEFADYVRLIRQAERMRGHPGKCVLSVEQDVRRVSRQSLVLRRDVEVGEMIHESDLMVQRPGTGIPAAEAPRAVGRRAARSIRTGTMLQWDMLEDAA